MGIVFFNVAVKVILTTFCILLFFQMHDMEKGEKKMWRAVVGSIVCCFGVLVTTVLPCAIGTELLIMLFCITVSMFMWKRFLFVRTFYLSVFFCFLYFATHVLVSTIGRLCRMEGDADSFWTELLATGILVVIIGGIRYIHVSYKESISTKRQWLSFFILLLNAILLLLEGMMVLLADENGKMILLILHLLCMCICGYVLVTDYGKKQAEYLAYMVNMIPLDREREEALENSIVSQRKKMHEYRNHIYCIYHLAQREGCHKIAEFIEGLEYEMYENPAETAFTGNTIIDVILNGKFRDAKTADIHIQMKTETLSDVLMKQEDLCVLFSNLLNNALEAAGKCKGSREIYVEVKMQVGRLAVVVENTHSNVVTEKDGIFFTTKTEESAVHGYGIKNIKEIVGKYNGECRITYTENVFRTEVLI